MIDSDKLDVPQVRIFPHSTHDYPEMDDLVMWLLNGLRARAGEYHLASADAVADLPPGSVVLFRYGHDIIGEAVVRTGKELCSGMTYAAKVTFAPSSIRLYSPPLSVNLIQPFSEKDITSSAQPYYKLSWDIYAKILKQVVSVGGFLND